VRLCGTYFQSAFRLFSVRGRKGQECSARRDRHGKLSIGKLVTRVNCVENAVNEIKTEEMGNCARPPVYLRLNGRARGRYLL
jgi:hypothetical protein